MDALPLKTTSPNLSLRGAQLKRVVVKIGSALLTPNGPLGPDAFNHLARGVISLRQHGVHVILVSSGAIAQGRIIRQLADPPKTLSASQALAALGQPQLMSLWAQALNPLHIAQFLLSQADIDDPLRSFNAQRALYELEEIGVVPIGNENDTVATDEIRIGDNDSLGAHIARVCHADLLVLLTQVDGLYTSNPELKSAIFVC